MLKESVFICYSTPNYSKLTDIFMKSLQDIEVINIEHCLDYPNPNLLSETGFQTKLWYYCVLHKIKHYVNTFKKYNNISSIKYIICSDCDIWFINNNKEKWNNLQNYIDQTSYDIYFMREFIFEDVNTGFFIIKNNDNIKNIINFFEDIIEKFNKSEHSHLPLGDQTLINQYRYNLNYGYIPNEYIVFGTTIYDRKQSLLHHAVACKDVTDKIYQIYLIMDQFKKK